MTRTERQAAVHHWVEKTFPETSHPHVRALRFLEESVELARAMGLSKYTANQIVNMVYEGNNGAAKDEVGDVGITLLALCAALGIDADDVEASTVTKVLQRDQASFEASQARKAFLLDAPLFKGTLLV